MTVVFQAKLDHFPDTFHQRVQISGLGVAAFESRDGRHIIAIFVALDKDREFSRLFHGPDFNTVKSAAGTRWE
jgi:hypothetical protein